MASSTPEYGRTTSVDSRRSLPRSWIQCDSIFDHPSNPGFPSYWHARGYGLFAANPLGEKIFSNGKEELNFTLAPHQSVTFRYRFLFHEGDEKQAKVAERFAEYAQQPNGKGSKP